MKTGFDRLTHRLDMAEERASEIEDIPVDFICKSKSQKGNFHLCFGWVRPQPGVRSFTPISHIGTLDYLLLSQSH